MAWRRLLCQLAGLLLVAGCGAGEAEQEEPPGDAAPTEAAPTDDGPTLDAYLMQDGEVPGLRPVDSPLTNAGEPFDLPPAGVKQLRRSGYVSTTFQYAEGERGAGVSSVLLFESAAGARDWMAYETSDAAIRHQVPGAQIDRFRVPDVEGARGWTGPDRHGNAIGHVYWTQGRCMMRTGGTCPG